MLGGVAQKLLEKEGDKRGDANKNHELLQRLLQDTEPGDSQVVIFFSVTVRSTKPCDD